MKLKRTIGLSEVVFYGVGIILGAGIFSLIGPAAGMTGNSLWMSFLFAAIIASFTGLSYCELSTMFPKAAAEYVYVRKAFGSRFFAFLIGWFIFFTGAIAAATVALGFGGYLKSLLGLPIMKAALVLILFLSYINFKGVKESSRFNVFLAAVTLLGLIVVIFLGIPNFGKVNYMEMPFGFNGVFAAAALIFFAYIGFEDIVNMAEETRRPRKVLPKAIILAVLITTVIYILTSLAVVSLADWKALSTSDAPLAFAASQAMGQKAFIFISITALFATAGTVLILLVVTSRMVYGMAKEKSLPEFMSRVHTKTRTPWLAVLIIMIFSIIFIFFGDIKTVAELTSLAAFLTFITVNLALIWLRFSMPNMKRAFRVPLNIGRFPVIAFLGIASSLFMVFQFKLNMLLLGLGVLVIGIIVYFVFMRKLNE